VKLKSLLVIMHSTVPINLNLQLSLQRQLKLLVN